MTTTTTSTRHESPDHDRATATIESPIGPLLVVADSHGVHELRFDAGATTASRGRRDACSDPSAEAMVQRTVAQLEEYFAGHRTTFDVPVVHGLGTEFQRRAWDVLVTIPFGTTWSYRDQATAMGVPRAVRAVGAANGRNPVPVMVPCHRVVGSDGSLTGYAGGTERKRWLLEHERRHAPSR